MKTFTFLVGIAFIVASTQAMEFSDQLKAELREHYRQCLHESGLTESETDFEKITHFPEKGDDEHIRKHIVCMGKKMNYFNEDGTLNKEVIKNKFLHVTKVPQDQIDKVMQDCVTKKDTIEETAAHYIKCEHQIIGRYNLKLHD